MTNEPGQEISSHVRFAVQIYLERLRRKFAFADYGTLFGEPAWDLLLSVFIATEQGGALSVTQVSQTTDLPLSTVQRYAGLLEKRGLLVRIRDDSDARRVLLRLTCIASLKMRAFLERSEPMPQVPAGLN
ncbi:MarR family winged helix-turn-helix transcriptional regulator [Sphingomonas colocasiae]|uniref:MarR family transcriptional regulator n=1 Tax=Sphingomonas colocasiae TaxID=1848973 RepID=A0ABS7PQZ1_9SPHN|nr:MarR family transcriptional regulator [Sphingomonas colocasiae]MBY8823399.1 MarR family transcriptional regulator [Sphingomonas colocasiae]